MNHKILKLPVRKLPTDKEFTIYIRRNSSATAAATPASEVVDDLDSSNEYDDLQKFFSSLAPDNERRSFCGNVYLKDTSKSELVLCRVLLCVCHAGEFWSLTARRLYIY